MNANYLPPSPSSFSELAFNVVDRGCFSDALTFPHELGHNMGARHDRENACSAGACTLVCCAGDASREQSRGNYEFSYGYRDPYAWRTVMAVSSGCAWPTFCPRIPYYSTPDALFEGSALGVAGGHAEGAADNATGFTLAAPVVANWRVSCVPEPNAWAMQLTSLLGFAWLRVSRRSRRRESAPIGG